MTKLEHHKKVTRESCSMYRGRSLVVELHSTFLRIRQKGKRSFQDLDYTVALEAAYKLEYMQKQREKKAEKKGKKKRG